MSNWITLSYIAKVSTISVFTSNNDSDHNHHSFKLCFIITINWDFSLQYTSTIFTIINVAWTCTTLVCYTQAWEIGLVYTMDHEAGPWKRAFFNGLSSWSDFLKKLVLKALGPSLGVNRMWTKKNDHAPKRTFLKKIQICPFSCLLLGFNCLHFLLNVSKMWLANLLTTIFTKKWAI